MPTDPSELSHQQWCHEQLAARQPPWPLLQLFIPAGQRASLLAALAFQQALMELVLSVREPDIASRKLAWWEDESTRYASSLHPGFKALRAAGLADCWDWSGWRAWCVQLHALLESGAPADEPQLWRQARLSAGIGTQLAMAALARRTGLAADFEEADIDRQLTVETQALVDTTAAWFLIEVVNRSSVQSVLQRWLPLALRARHKLRWQDGTVQPCSRDALSLTITDMLQPAAAALQLDWPSGEVKKAYGLPVQRLLAMQRRLAIDALQRLRHQADTVLRQPVNLLGPLSAWRCWRAVRQTARF